MNRLLLSILLLTSLSFCSCSSHKGISSSSNQRTTNDIAIAFPGAEGFGKYATGGRGGKVLLVTNLNDNGPGSLRHAINEKGARIIIFTVSGTIQLQSKLIITSDITIAGQSAPGDGICLADYPVSMVGNNIIIRYMRFRMGDRHQNQGFVDGAGGDDAFSGIRNRNVIIDHCSMSWSTDEVCSVYAGDSLTLQWNLIAEPLNYSYHFEAGDKDFEHHGFGGIMGGLHTSFHHNLYAHCANRTPRFNGTRHTPTEFVDFRNNVIYNWGSNNVYAGEGGSYNIINNYYKPGPDTKEAVKSRIANPWKNERIPFGRWYIDGNFAEGAPAVTKDNWLGVVLTDGTSEDVQKTKSLTAHNAEPVSTQSALEAYKFVLKDAGATLPNRDTLDRRIINDVKNGTGRIIDVQGGFPHATPYAQTVNAWPTLKSTTAPPDTDKDGMPDAWETKNGLNPKDPTDASGKKPDKFYTNIEMYLNSLVH